MRPRFGYIIIVLILNISCTAYEHTSKAAEGTDISRAHLKDLKVNDKALIRLKTGQALRTRVLSLNDEFMEVRLKRNQKQVLYYQQLAKIKYGVNVPVTALKISGVVVAVPIILFILFPPQISFTF